MAEIYRDQGEIENSNRAMYAAWRQASADWANPRYLHDQIRSTRAYLSDLVAAEERLLRKYEQAIEQLTLVPGQRH